ncbi:MAG: PQQ-dependent sugar dehydrogenase [Myxococcales bacterium]|nr:PQQ-dependent sugar dehydrogenase [Myxococcales bacterium]
MPVFVTSPPSDPRLFVLEKTGAIKIISGGQVLAEPFLTVDVSNVSSLDDERGLLGLAFHPQYAQNHKFYVYYTDNNGDEVVDQYLADAGDPDRADPASTQQVFFLDDFAGNHNGGTLAFGPDGYLYFGIGDGGGANDPMAYGQNTGVAFAKLLRVDVSTLPYTIPADNPFVGQAGLDETWSYGLRNPWRWSFDRATGDLYIGDVGQGLWEEIDVVAAGAAAGLNFGWSVMEGTHCFNPGSGCDTSAKVQPVYEYDHGQGSAVIGGYVYRGCRMPGWQGTYFFADYGGHWVRSFTWDGSAAVGVQEHDGLRGGDIVSFGQDAAGELYVVRQDSGQIMQIVPQ